MSKQKFEVELDVPDGYEFDGLRPPKAGELFYNLEGNWSFSDIDSKRIFIVLRKIPKYREPVLPADWGKQARFSDDGKEWVEDTLIGYYKYIRRADEFVWLVEKRCYKFCQVLDE